MPSWEYRIVAKQLNADKSPDEPPPPPPPEENNKKPKKKGGKKPSAVKPDGKSVAATEKMLPKPKKMRFLLQKKSFRRLLKLPARQNLKTNRAVFLKECVFKMADGNDF